MVKRFINLCLVVFILSIGTVVYGTDLKTISLGDTVVNKPSIIEYFYSDNIEGLSVEAFLNNESLKISTVVPASKLSELGVDTNYLFLVDESTSISDLEMAKIKQSLTKAIDNLKGGETVTLVAFGENIDVKTDHLSDKQAIKNAVATLNNDKEGTVFFDAIKKAGEICNTKAGDRNLVFVISDGIDFNTGGYTYGEIEKYVTDAGITIFALALGDRTDAYIDQFGQLARKSSGFIEVCNIGNLDQKVLLLLSKAQNAFAVSMESKNNTVSQNVEKLVINFTCNGNKTTLEKNVASKNWVKDTEAPVIESVEKVSKTSLSVKFSEDVLNADNVANYKIILNGKYELNVESVNYDRELHTANIVFDDGVFGGNYTIECLNITDNSMEKNPVLGNYEGKFAGQSYQAAQFEKVVAEYWLFFFIIVLAVAGGIFYAVIRKRKGIIIHEKKIKFKDSMVDKERIVAPTTTNISLYVTGIGGLKKKIEMRMYKSLIVGRSEMCDVSFDDRLLSRQHFAIEENDGIYTIMNLSETNGTIVNGVPLKGKYKLSDGDVIIAGNEKFVFSSK
ncbi:MAG: FHA domain-containing protein [Lachnospirales bacterium]